MSQVLALSGPVFVPRNQSALGPKADNNSATKGKSVADTAGRKLNAADARGASLPLDAVRRARDTPIWKLEPSFPMPVLRHASLQAAGSHDQVD